MKVPHPTTIPLVSAASTVELAKLLRIRQHEGGHKDLWKPNASQVAFWHARDEAKWLLVAKPRQIGLSTAVCLDDATWAATNDNEGHAVRVGIVVDTEDKAIERVGVCADLLDGMGMDFDRTAHKIQFPNGSTIEGVTASGHNVGRSLTFQRLHITELPYWRDPEGTYRDLLQSLTLGGSCVIETTMDTIHPFPRWLWDNSSEYKKVFLPVEIHEEYRKDPNDLSESRWKELQKEGFSRRDAVSWWEWAKREKCGGDEVKAFKEYPQLEKHLFQIATGLWVARRPVPREPIDVRRVLGIRGDDWPILVYKDPKDVRRAIIGVDTAEGKGLDRSVCIVVDESDWRVAAICASDRMIFDDLARVTYELQRIYTNNGNPCRAFIEEIGIGSATVAAARTLGVVFDVVTPTEEGKYEGLLAAKMAVESGLLIGPDELTQECDELHRDAKTGAFKGRKDILMAYGFCARHMKGSPWLEKPKVKSSEEVIDAKKILRAHMRREAQKRWMPW